jgi:hypothetical protein
MTSAFVKGDKPLFRRAPYLPFTFLEIVLLY